jgi:hypothetical protein
MKLRIRGNTIRFRLTQSEVARLGSGAGLQDSTEFSPAQVLTWLLQPAPIPAIEATFRDAAITVSLPESAVKSWAGSDEVGLYGQSGALEVSVEKDFRCLAHEGAAEEPDAFPHPQEAGKC